jgi:hypothetical protein
MAAISAGPAVSIAALAAATAFAAAACGPKTAQLPLRC